MTKGSKQFVVVACCLAAFVAAFGSSALPGRESPHPRAAVTGRGGAAVSPPAALRTSEPPSAGPVSAPPASTSAADGQNPYSADRWTASLAGLVRDTLGDAELATMSVDEAYARYRAAKVSTYLATVTSLEANPEAPPSEEAEPAAPAADAYRSLRGSAEVASDSAPERRANPASYLATVSAFSQAAGTSGTASTGDAE